MIERSKKNRVILLTTHSMEEADTLGDRICIMSKGNIQALGSKSK
jgi:ABC-type multidrug transport system ATPase subunit